MYEGGCKGKNASERNVLAYENFSRLSVFPCADWL
jgi:hypothetical protein